MERGGGRRAEFWNGSGSKIFHFICKVYSMADLSATHDTDLILWRCSVDVAVRLNLDPRKPDQALRGLAVLPKGEYTHVNIGRMLPSSLVATEFKTLNLHSAGEVACDDDCFCRDGQGRANCSFRNRACSRGSEAVSIPFVLEEAKQ